MSVARGGGGCSREPSHTAIRLYTLRFAPITHTFETKYYLEIDVVGWVYVAEATQNHKGTSFALEQSALGPTSVLTIVGGMQVAKSGVN